MGILHKNIQLMLEFLKAPFLVIHLPYYTLVIFLVYVICNIAICADDTILSTLSVIRHLIRQLKLASELESDLGDTVDWRRN